MSDSSTQQFKTAEEAFQSLKGALLVFAKFPHHQVVEHDTQYDFKQMEDIFIKRAPKGTKVGYLHQRMKSICALDSRHFRE